MFRRRLLSWHWGVRTSTSYLLQLHHSCVISKLDDSVWLSALTCVSAHPHTHTVLSLFSYRHPTSTTSLLKAAPSLTPHWSSLNILFNAGPRSHCCWTFWMGVLINTFPFSFLSSSPSTLNLCSCASHHPKSRTYQYIFTGGSKMSARLAAFGAWPDGTGLGWNALLPAVDRYI